MSKINFSLDLLPPHRKEINLELQEYIESYLTESRKNILRRVLEDRTKYLCFVAENLIDEHNIHAIIRSSECFGLQNFHNIREENVNLKKNKSVTRGALQWTHIYDYSQCNQPTKTCISHLKSQGYKVYGTSSHLENHYTPQNVPIDSPLAIIMGKEHTGISQDAIDNCDGMIYIPMYGFTESFNVSVAASLIAQPIISRIKDSNLPWQISDKEKENLYYEWIWMNIKNPDVLYKEWAVNISKA